MTRTTDISFTRGLVYPGLTQCRSNDSKITTLRREPSAVFGCVKFISLEGLPPAMEENRVKWNPVDEPNDFKRGLGYDYVPRLSNQM